MEEITEVLYTWILTKTDGTYLGWSKAIDEPHNGDTANLKWIEWNKPLPEDIDSVEYTIDSLSEWYNNLEVV